MLFCLDGEGESRTISETDTRRIKPSKGQSSLSADDRIGKWAAENKRHGILGQEARSCNLIADSNWQKIAFSFPFLPTPNGHKHTKTRNFKESREDLYRAKEYTGRVIIFT